MDSLRDWQFLLPPQPPLVFTARSQEALFPSTGTLGSVVWLGAGITPSPGVPPSFYPPPVNVGPPIPPYAATATASPSPFHPWSPSPPLLPIWMNISSLNP